MWHCSLEHETCLFLETWRIFSCCSWNGILPLSPTSQWLDVLFLLIGGSVYAVLEAVLRVKEHQQNSSETHQPQSYLWWRCRLAWFHCLDSKAFLKLLRAPGMKTILGDCVMLAVIFFLVEHKNSYPHTHSRFGGLSHQFYESAEERGWYHIKHTEWGLSMSF